MAIVGAAAHEQVDVRVLGIPVPDRDPVEPGAEIVRGARHQLARECLQVGELARVVGRDDEAEMVTVAVAALDERASVRRLTRGVEQPSGGAIARDAVALEIADVGGERARRPHTANDTRLDHRAARAVAEQALRAEARGSAPPEPPASASPAAARLPGRA